MKTLPDRYKKLTSVAIKVIALVCMIIDHIAVLFLQSSFTQAAAEPFALSLSEGYALFGCSFIIYKVMRCIGRISFPLYAFILVEGFTHTHSFPKYLIKVLLFACISEVVYDLAITGTPADMSKQNVLFTMFLGLLALKGMEKINELKLSNPLYTNFACIACAFICAAVAMFFKTDYQGYGVLAIVAIYFFRNAGPVFSVAVACAVLIYGSSAEWWALLALPIVLLYNFRLGKAPQKKYSRYVFYISYPLHLLILYAIKLII